MNTESKVTYLKAVGAVFIIALVAQLFFRRQMEDVKGMMVERITCKDIK